MLECVYMPIVNADVKGLEVVVAAQLSGDATLKQELIDKVDIHEVNRDKFKLGVGKPGRLIAKVFTFRLIYGGSAYSYAHDPDFMSVSTSQKFWQNVIDAYYEKYSGIAEWHAKRLMKEVNETRRITIPSGRYFPIVPDYTKREPWPLTVIKNYPVQGFGADLVMLARLRASQLLQQREIPGTLIGTIHDSIVADAETQHVVRVAEALRDAVADVPRLCREIWNYDFSLPLTSEVSYGPSKYEQKELTF